MAAFSLPSFSLNSLARAFHIAEYYLSVNEVICGMEEESQCRGLS